MFKREWRTKLVTITTTAVIATMGAMALAATPAETIKSRQDHLKELGKASKSISDTLKTDAPDAAVIKSAGAVYKSAAADIANWFPKGTGPEAGVETKAKAEIWTDAAGFADKIKNFQTEANKLAALADAGDVEGVRAQVRKVGPACGACHDNYRVKKEG
jgi:cytochrome c556